MMGDTLGKYNILITIIEVNKLLYQDTNIPGGRLYSYGIADYGNIIVVMDDDTSAEMLWYLVINCVAMTTSTL